MPGDAPGRAPEPAAASYSWKVLIDAGGAIQSAEGYWPLVNGPVSAGSSYYDVLASICGESYERASTIKAGIRAVAAGQVDNFSLEFPCRLPDGEARMRLMAFHAAWVGPGASCWFMRRPTRRPILKRTRWRRWAG